MILNYECFFRLNELFQSSLKRLEILAILFCLRHQLFLAIHIEAKLNAEVFFKAEQVFGFCRRCEL